MFPNQEWLIAEPSSQGIDPRLLGQAVERFGAICGKDGSHGMVVIRNGRMVWHGDTIDALVKVHSCTKSILSTCFGLLCDDGKCTPATLAATIVPQLSERYPALTLGQLATLTDGFIKEKDSDVLHPAQPLFPPGTALHYDFQPDLL
ncbi:MAG: serine hydrolase, partial [Planctomycetota bacterium]